MDESGHNPPREATEEQIEGDERVRGESEPFEGGYGAELEWPPDESNPPERPPQDPPEH